MALKAVFFDVGETLVDEERWWRLFAERLGLQPHVIWAALGVTIERGEEHNALWRHLGHRAALRLVDESPYDHDDLYPDAIASLEGVRALGLRDRDRRQSDGGARAAGCVRRHFLLM